jgi:hypothetical protein
MTTRLRAHIVVAGKRAAAPAAPVTEPGSVGELEPGTQKGHRDRSVSRAQHNDSHASRSCARGDSATDITTVASCVVAT